MSHNNVSAEGADLTTTIADAVAELLDLDSVSLDLDVPGAIAVRDVKVSLTALVESNGAADEDSDDAGAAAAVATTSKDESESTSDQDSDSADDSDDSGDPAAAGDGDAAVDHGDQLDREVDVAADFVDGILNAMDLAGQLELRLNDEEQSAEVEVVDMDSGALIGRRGSTLEAVQELMRCALQSKFDRRVRITVDVEGYRARRLEKLLDKADEAIDDVLDSGESVRLEPMDVFERKSVHELVGTVEGVLSRSQGREPSRRVVIEPSED